MKEDDLPPIKSGNDAIEFRPSTVSTMTFSLDQIKSIKNKLGNGEFIPDFGARITALRHFSYQAGTVNDVLTGMIFFGTRLYMQEINQSSSKADCTSIMLINTRFIGDYVPIEEMMKPTARRHGEIVSLGCIYPYPS
ncbi:unnamed protein product [Prunus armeniaca]|uniref:Uncharacterized protein n=1 Tax=Prunus armeniaca TaxID=36596 RepID=A0A6J5WZI6_PRUAR|nr:unnamed protein product [Prunus armeniaca]